MKMRAMTTRRLRMGKVTTSSEVASYVSIYDRWAEKSGELNYDAYWERRFEHNLNDDAYRLAANQLGEIAS